MFTSVKPSAQKRVKAFVPPTPSATLPPSTAAREQVQPRVPPSTQHLQQQREVQSNRQAAYIDPEGRVQIEPFADIPSSVAEAIRQTKDLTRVSGRFEGGFAWVVVPKDDTNEDATIFFWECTENMVARCSELPFPATDSLPHANLVTFTEAHNRIGLIACSSEGHARIWQSAKDQAFTDTKLRLDDYCEVLKLVHHGDVAVLGMSSGTASLAIISYAGAVRLLRYSKGGWGSKLFGNNIRSPAVRSIVATERDLFVLTETSLQKWDVTHTSDKLTHEVPLRDTIDALMTQTDPRQRPIGSWLLDVKMSKKGYLYVLVANTYKSEAKNEQLNLTYSVVTIDASNFSDIVNHFQLPHSHLFSARDAEVPYIRVGLEIYSNGRGLYVHWPDQVVCVRLARPQDRSVLPSYDGPIIACGQNAQGVPLFQTTGTILAIHQYWDAEDVGDDDPAELEEDEPQTPYEVLKRALSLCSTQPRQAQSYVTRLDAPELSAAASQLSLEIIDSAPSADPNWAEEKGNRSEAPMFVRDFLESKSRKHQYFEEFLSDRSSGNLWAKLSPSTQQIILENKQKLAAAKNLRAYQNEAGEIEILTQAIHGVLHYRNPSWRQGDTNHNSIFYTKVSDIEQILDATLSVYTRVRQRPVADLIAANSVFQRILSQLEPDVVNRDRQTPSNLKSIRGVAQAYINDAVKYLDSAPPEASKIVVLQQFREITDKILAAYQVSFVGDATWQGSNIRQALLLPFLQHDKNAALELADKYQDFATMTQVCEVQGDKNLLHDKMNKFSNAGMPTFVFKFYTAQKRWDDLLDLPQDFSAALTQFLEGNKALSWVHHWRTGEFGAAALALYDVANDETESAQRKSLLFSLCKLSMIAFSSGAAQSDQINDVEGRLYLLQAQERLVVEGAANKGRANEDLHRPLPAVEVILRTLKLREKPTVNDFIMALEIFRFSIMCIPANEKESILVKIWTFALEQTPWSKLAEIWEQQQNDEQAAAAMRDSTFYQVFLSDRSTGLLHQSLWAQIKKLYMDKQRSSSRELDSHLDRLVMFAATEKQK